MTINYNVLKVGSTLQFSSGNITHSGNFTATSGNFTTLRVNQTNVSLNGHNHTSNDITNFNSSVSGLLPNITGAGVATSNFSNNTYTINVPTDARFDYFKPPAPTNLIGTRGSTLVDLLWSAPTVLAQVPITDYLLQFSSDNGTTWSLFNDGVTTATSGTVTGLTNGTTYRFRVAAVNGIGQGNWSSISTPITPSTIPPAAVLLAFDGANNSTTFIDSSSQQRTITRQGSTVVISTAQSKFGGSSGFFTGGQGAGTPDGVSFPISYSLSNNDWTIEFWMRPSIATQYRTVFQTNASSSQLHCHIYTDGKLYVNDSAVGNIAAGNIIANTWTYIAIVQNGSNWFLYQEGVRVQTATKQTLGSITGWALGYSTRFDGGTSYAGYFDDFRITTGSALYTGSTMQVPTAALEP